MRIPTTSVSAQQLANRINADFGANDLVATVVDHGYNDHSILVTNEDEDTLSLTVDDVDNGANGIKFETRARLAAFAAALPFATAGDYRSYTEGDAVIAEDATSIVVHHGMIMPPVIQDIRVTPTNNMGDATKFWVSAVTAQTFTITVSAVPGEGDTATFAWRVDAKQE